MRQGKSAINANRIKKQRRMESKKDLQKYYTKIARVPTNKKKEVYTKIVDLETADKLVLGKPIIMNNIVIKREPLSRKFKKVS